MEITMIDYAGLYRELMNADNRAFVEQIKAEQERKQQELEAQADCECNGGGFTYCGACHGE
jgi:regulator of protease activity HflC (stomatin/prohibitin superfamily)